MLKLNLPTASETSSLKISYTSQNPQIFKIGDLNEVSEQSKLYFTHYMILCYVKLGQIFNHASKASEL